MWCGKEYNTRYEIYYIGISKIPIASNTQGLNYVMSDELCRLSRGMTSYFLKDYSSQAMTHKQYGTFLDLERNECSSHLEVSRLPHHFSQQDFQDNLRTRVPHAAAALKPLSSGHSGHTRKPILARRAQPPVSSLRAMVLRALASLRIGKCLPQVEQ